MNHPLFLFFLLTLLNGILLTLILLGRQTPDWLKNHGILLILLPGPLGFIVISLIMEFLGMLSMLSVPRLLIISGLLSLILLAPALRAATAIPWRKLTVGTPVSREILFFVIALLFLSNAIHPTEFLFGTRDSGPYLAAGAQAFRTGSFYFTEDQIVTADNEFKHLFYRIRQRPEFQRYGELATGFPILDPAAGRVGPRYFMLHSLWLGLFFTLFGLKAALTFATPWVGFLAFIAVYLTARAVAGVTPALLTALLMSSHLIPVWFSRYITTEMAVTAPLFTGLALLLCFDDSKNGWIPAGILAGSAVGLAHFARIDSILLVPVTLAFIALSICFRNRPRRIISFAAAYTVVLSGAALSAGIVTLPYTLETFRHLQADPLKSLLVSLGLLAVSAALTVAVYFRRAPLMALFQRRRTLLLGALIGGLTLLALHGYFLRPILNPVDEQAYRAADILTRSKSLTQMTLRWMGWYMTLPGLILALTGSFILLAGKWSVKSSFFFLTGLMYSLFFFYSQRCTPMHLWVMRRYSTVVIPVLMIGLGFSFYFFWRAVSGRRYQTAGKVVLTLGFAALLTTYTVDLQRVRRFPLWKGAVAATEEIHLMLPENAVLVLEKTPGAYFYTPLKFLYDTEVYIRHRPDLIRQWETAVNQWKNTGREVYLMTFEPAREETIGFVLERMISRRRLYPLLSQTSFEKPRKTRRFRMTYYLYRLGEDIL